MPCYDSRDFRPVRVEYRTDPYWEERCHEVTRLLCGLCRELEKNGWSVDNFADAGLKAWWKDHQKADARRSRKKKRSKARL